MYFCVRLICAQHEMASACMTMMGMCMSASRVQERVHPTQTSSPIPMVMQQMVMNQSPAADAHRAAAWQSRVRFDSSRTCKQASYLSRIPQLAAALTPLTRNADDAATRTSAQPRSADLTMCREPLQIDEETSFWSGSDCICIGQLHCFSSVTRIGLHDSRDCHFKLEVCD